jgi:hypothetical protein
MVPAYTQIDKRATCNNPLAAGTPNWKTHFRRCDHRYQLTANLDENHPRTLCTPPIDLFRGKQQAIG